MCLLIIIKNKSIGDIGNNNGNIGLILIIVIISHNYFSFIKKIYYNNKYLMMSTDASNINKNNK